MKKLLLPIVILVALYGCNKDEDPPHNFDFLMFGHFYGLCAGEECIEIYKITDDKLFEANQDTYPGDNMYTGTFVGLSEALFEQVNAMDLAVPQALLDVSETTIGIPDAYDQGGFYVEWKSGNTHRHWRIDTNYDAVPEGIHDFLDQVQEAIQIIP